MGFIAMTVDYTVYTKEVCVLRIRAMGIILKARTPVVR